MSDWHRLGVAELAACYRAGVPVAAVVAHHLRRIAGLDPILHTFIEVDEAGALRAAAESQRHVDGGQPRALEGVPVAVKANIAVAGLDWNAGMDARRGIKAERDAAVVARLRAAGAIVLGTLNMHEAALGATSDNPFFGRVANPHDRARTPGGSSGGSGAAVAAGLCTVALGTDTMGSVRIPAAYCGVFGLKPGRGVVPAAGLVPASETLDVIGPLARSADDIAATLAVIGDPQPTAAATAARLLVLDPAYGLECAPGVAGAFEQALAALAPLTAAPVGLPDDAAAVRVAGFLHVARALSGHLAGLDPARFSDELRFMLDYAAGQPEARHVEASAVLARTRAALLAAIGDDGVLLTATAPQSAFLHTNRPPVTQSGFTALANIAGLPAFSVPAGRDAAGMPVAVQLIGAPGAEPALIALGRRIEAVLCGYFPPALLIEGEC
jgi:aspartyl-tRNA(Asn)/glutamyl-tRNA(Gln) amidotransferase subunit A